MICFYIILQKNSLRLLSFKKTLTLTFFLRQIGTNTVYSTVQAKRGYVYILSQKTANLAIFRKPETCGQNVIPDNLV